MGMTVGGSRGRSVSDPNIVPLIDVLLVLIIIFMVITPTVPTGLPTLIPQPSQPESKSDLANPYAIVVQVMEDGKIMINREQTDWENLGARLSDIFRQRAEKVGFVDGAEDVPFADVARAIDIMRDAGIEHIGMITAADKNKIPAEPRSYFNVVRWCTSSPRLVPQLTSYSSRMWSSTAGERLLRRELRLSHTCNLNLI
jgi:biopolymer transport protein TolR